MIGKKIRLCVNSNIEDPKFIEILSEECKIQTVHHLISENLSPEDPEIMIRANEKDFHIITANIKDFKRYFRTITTIKIGVIGIPAEYFKCLPVLRHLLQREIKVHSNLYNKFYEMDSTGQYRCWDKSWKAIIQKTSL